MITADMITTLTDSLKADLTVLIPAGLSVMAIMLGVNLVPRVIKKFL